MYICTHFIPLLDSFIKIVNNSNEKKTFLEKYVPTSLLFSPLLLPDPDFLTQLLSVASWSLKSVKAEVEDV